MSCRKQIETVEVDFTEWEVAFYYHPAYPSSFFDPGEPEEYEIISVQLVDLTLHTEEEPERPTDEQIIEALSNIEPEIDYDYD